MTIRFTSQGCKVETTCVICPNGRYTENIVLSVDPASQLAIETEENAGRNILAGGRGWENGRVLSSKPAQVRVRATRHGFELIERRP